MGSIQSMVMRKHFFPRLERSVESILEETGNRFITGCGNDPGSSILEFL